MPRKQPAQTKPLTRAKSSLDQLILECGKLVPGFAYNLFGYPGLKQVMFQWRYNQVSGSALWDWQRRQPGEAHMGGSYSNVREAFISVLERVDRFDAWTKEQADLKAKAEEAAARAARAAAAAPVPKPEEDEGEERVPAEELPEVEPVPPIDPLLEGVLKGVKSQ